jgi:phosphatidate cytidylyltransferase
VLAARLATAFVAIPLLIGAVWLGGPLLWALAVLAAVIASRETFALLAGSTGSGWLVVAVVSAAVLVGVTELGPAAVVAALAAIVAIHLTWIVANWPGPDAGPEIARLWTASLAGALYAGLPLGLLVLMRGWLGAPVVLAPGVAAERGAAWVLLAFTLTWAVDSLAYAAGRLVGRHPFAPRLSPKKTWEGTAAGVAAGTLVGLAWSGALALPILLACALGLVASVAAVIGDLAESGLKRAAEAKDSGSLLPGHGGLLDRLDSLGFVLIVVFLSGTALGYR